MTRIGFWYDYGVIYSGGLNYFRNLLYALSLVEKKTIEPYVFFGSDADQHIIDEFTPLATVVLTPVLRRKTLSWLVHRSLYRLFGSQFMVNRTVKDHDIAVVSHASMVSGRNRHYGLITWIADFQYLHLPELFPGLDVAKKNRSLNALVRDSDIVIVSSNDALKDLESIVPPEQASKARVLQFVSQPSKSFVHGAAAEGSLNRKYGFTGKYFFLPNQFWTHKNHMVAFKAIKELKDRGIDLLLVCTGWLCDPRFKRSEYVTQVMDFVDQNHLHDNIKILGHIDYNDVLLLLKNSVAVLNPSRFEGWSSSVEEAKSIGKTVILSNIGVHLEQDPPRGIYFDPDDHVSLSHILNDVWNNWDPATDVEEGKRALELLRLRTIEFGNRYLDIVTELLPGL